MSEAATKLIDMVERTLAQRDALSAALLKIRHYNVDIIAGRINYRPEDHIEVIDTALRGLVETVVGSGK